MTTTFTGTAQLTDAELVTLSLAGDRTAYAAIVERYQQLICAITYASCGDLHLSEDLAQETFLAAWRSLPQLKDPHQLRAWLRGIARNVVHNALRKQGRTPPTQSQPDSDVLSGGSATPSDEAISREEHALLWQNLSRLPEEYREPMVLYYRQGQSTAAVAAALEISEDAARQRLSRGRAMLAQRIEHLIDRGLRTSGPGKAFAVAVVAALPGLAVSHSASALGLAAAKSGASAKAVATIAGVANILLGPMIGLGSTYVGYRIGLEQTVAPEEHRFVRRFFVKVFFFALAFTGIILGTIFGARWLRLGPTVSTALMVTLTTSYVAGLVTLSLWYSRRIRAMRAELTANQPELREKAQRSAEQWKFHYRSRWSLLGLPLIHINIGGTPDLRMPVAKGWIAIGTIAYSPLLAIGTIAIAPISWGAFSAGVLTYGGIAIGIWSIGIFAVGWKSIGVCAIAWKAAQGVVAMAFDYASGINALARHVDDARANAFFQSSSLFRTWDWIANHCNWLWLICLFPMLIMVRRARRIRQTVRV
jgi:RNA polymerase sigma factor (sigma-70 family)